MTRAILRSAILWLWALTAAGHLAAQAPALERDARTVVDQLGGGGAAYSMRSAILGETRRINVATPASFAATGPNRRYPAMVVFDGEYSFARTIAAAKYLAEAGQVPEALVVAVENLDDSPGARVRDLTPPGLSVSGSSMNEGGDRFLDFLEKELLPALATQFRAGAPSVLIGHSSGGILGTWAAATRSAAFPFVVAIDTPTNLQQGWLATRLTESARKTPANFLRYASLESRFGWSDKSWGALQSAAPPAWKLHREKLVNESHNSMAFLATYIGLRQVFAEYSMLAAPDSPTSASIEHYRKFNEASGQSLIPPRPLLTRTIEDLLIEGNATRAQAALDMLIAGYGDTPRAAGLRAQIAEAAKLPSLAVTVEDLLRAPKPDPRPMAPFLGEWNGFSQLNDGPRQPIRVRFEVKNGQVVGTLVQWPAPDVELVSNLSYIKVVDGGLHFGRMNGMRPRGMLVNEMVLRHGRLEGEMHIRGVNFREPPGMPPHTITWTLERTKPGLYL